MVCCSNKFLTILWRGCGRADAVVSNIRNVSSPDLSVSGEVPSAIAPPSVVGKHHGRSVSLGNEVNLIGRDDNDVQYLHGDSLVGQAVSAFQRLIANDREKNKSAPVAAQDMLEAIISEYEDAPGRQVVLRPFRVFATYCRTNPDIWSRIVANKLVFSSFLTLIEYEMKLEPLSFISGPSAKKSSSSNNKNKRGVQGAVGGSIQPRYYHQNNAPVGVLTASVAAPAPAPAPALVLAPVAPPAGPSHMAPPAPVTPPMGPPYTYPPPPLPSTTSSRASSRASSVDEQQPTPAEVKLQDQKRKRERDLVRKLQEQGLNVECDEPGENAGDLSGYILVKKKKKRY